MVIHGLERRTFKDKEDLDRTDKDLSSSSRNKLWILGVILRDPFLIKKGKM